MTKCKYKAARTGRCNSYAIEGGYCKEHASVICISCGAKATHDCATTGRPVCDSAVCNCYDSTPYNKPKPEKGVHISSWQTKEWELPIE